MIEPTQIGLGAKILGLLTKPVIFISRIFTDQTKLKLLFPRGTETTESTAWIFEEDPVNGPGVGLLYFGVTTGATHEVEICEISVQFAAPLELKNPGEDPFFESGQTTNNERPFALIWRGSTMVTSSIIQTFGIEAHFHDGIKVRDVELVIKARRCVPEVGGFESKRRTKPTSTILRIRLTSERPRGFEIPQHVSSRSPQPFIRKARLELQGDANLVRVDYIDEDGRPRSRMHSLPGSEPEGQDEQPT